MATSTSKLDKPISSRGSRVPLNLRFWNRFAASRIFGGGLCIAILCVFGISWVSIFIFELAAVYLMSEFLVGHLPSQIEDQLQRNCVRMDGSWSCRREELEGKAVNKLRWDIRVVFLMIMIPTTLLIWLFDREVAPISIGFSAVSKISVPGERWKENLEDEEQRFDAWVERSDGSFDTDGHKRFLWKAWPVIALIGLVWLVSCGLLIQRMFIYQLNDLAKGIEERKWEYTLVDRSRSVEWRD